MYNQLGALSPLDGRYASSVKDLNVFFSEAALMRYRIYIEIEYLIALSLEKKIKEFPTITKNQVDELRKVYQKFDMDAAKKIKESATCAAWKSPLRQWRPRLLVALKKLLRKKEAL